MGRVKAKHAKPGNPSLLLIFIICLGVSIILIACYFCFVYRERKMYDNILENVQIDTSKVTESKTKRMLQVEKLKKENSDIVGWLEIEAAEISYPVLQCEDNDYYLTRNYKKENSSAGSLFLDKDYDFKLPSSNLLIYGHRNKRGLMFENLVKYKEEEFYKKNPTLRFTTEKEDSTYEIIAAFNSRVYYKNEKNVFRYYYFVNAKNKKEYEDFVTNAKKESIYDTGKTAKYGDQLLTLSTCDYIQEDGRFAVVAKKVK